MSKTTKIQWCDSTFNPWWGCTRVSPGCYNCYAAAIAQRFKRCEWGAGKPRVRTSPENWHEVRKWNKYQIWECPHGCGHKFKLPLGRKPARTADSCACRNASDELTETDMFVPRKPRVFAGSMCDWLDPTVPAHWLADFLTLIAETPNLDWMLLSKRIDNWKPLIMHTLDFAQNSFDDSLYYFLEGWMDKNPPSNIWLGTTVENQEQANKRIPELLKIPAKIRFLSCEPLLENVDLRRWINIQWKCGKCGQYFTGELQKECPNCKAIGYWCGSHEFNGKNRKFDGIFPDDSGTAIDWVICGGETGAKARPMHPAWARSLRNQCASANVPFFFKSNGTYIHNSQITDEDDLPECTWKLSKEQLSDCFLRTKDVCAKYKELLDGNAHHQFPTTNKHKP
jgi:protein gp37